MTKEEIFEGNKLIAKFMGWEVDDYTGREVNYFVEGQLDVYPKVVSDWVAFQHMKFHSSWDWLMSVVEKIESLGIYTDICKRVNTKYHNVTIDDVNSKKYIADRDSLSKKEAVWNACIEFIKHYNSTNNTNSSSL